MSSQESLERNELEDAIRTALINRTAHEYSRTMSNPDLQNGFEEHLYKAAAARTGSEGLRFGPGKDVGDLVIAQVSARVREMFAPIRIRTGALETAMNQYRNPEEARAEFENTFATPEMAGLGEAMEPLLGYLSRTAQVVSELGEIAEREGLDTALARETEYRVLRSMFPTAQAYVAHALQPVQAATDYLAAFEEFVTLTAPSEADREEVVESISVQRVLMEWAQPYIERMLEEKASAIYNA